MRRFTLPAAITAALTQPRLVTVGDSAGGRYVSGVVVLAVS